MKHHTIILVIVMLLSSYSFAFMANSTSYTIDSFHMGSAGGVGNSTSYTERSTLTYQQPGNGRTSSTNFLANIGWFTRAPVIPPVTLFIVYYGPNTTTPGLYNQTLIFANVTATQNASNLTARLVYPNGTITTVFTNTSNLEVSFANLTDGQYFLTGYGYSLNLTNLTAPVYSQTPTYNIFISTSYNAILLTVTLVAILFLGIVAMLVFAEFGKHQTVGIFAAVLLIVLGVICLVVPLRIEQGITVTSIHNSVSVQNCTGVNGFNTQCLGGNGSTVANSSLNASQTKIINYAPVATPYTDGKLLFGLVFLLLGIILLLKYAMIF